MIRHGEGRLDDLAKQRLGHKSRTTYDWIPSYEAWPKLLSGGFDMNSLRLGALLMVEGTERLMSFLDARRDYCSSMFALNSSPRCPKERCPVACFTNKTGFMDRIKGVPNVLYHGLNSFLDTRVGNCLQARGQVSGRPMVPVAGELRARDIDNIARQLAANYVARPLSDGQRLPDGYIERFPLIVRGAGLFVSALFGTRQLPERTAHFMADYRQQVIDPYCDWQQ